MTQHPLCIKVGRTKQASPITLTETADLPALSRRNFLGEFGLLRRCGDDRLRIWHVCALLRGRAPIFSAPLHDALPSHPGRRTITPSRWGTHGDPRPDPPCTAPSYSLCSKGRSHEDEPGEMAAGRKAPRPPNTFYPTSLHLAQPSTRPPTLSRGIEQLKKAATVVLRPSARENQRQQREESRRCKEAARRALSLWEWSLGSLLGAAA